MPQELNIELQVNFQEAEYIIPGLAECKYKDVYIVISKLKQLRRNGDASETISVKLDLDQAQRTLDKILDKPFRDVYKLVGQINEEVKKKLAAENVKAVDAEVSKNKIAESISEPESMNVALDNEEIDSDLDDEAFLSVSEMDDGKEESIGKTLPKDLLQRLSEHKKYMELSGASN